MVNMKISVSFFLFWSIFKSNIFNSTEIDTENMISILFLPFWNILCANMAESNTAESNMAADGLNKKTEIY